MTKQLEYRVYYGDGSTYDGPIDDMPVLDVQAIVTIDKCRHPYGSGRLIFQSWDYYLYEDDQWCGVNGMPDLVDHVLHANPKKVAKGRMIRNDKYQDIMHKTLEDKDFPKKSRHMQQTEDGTD